MRNMIFACINLKFHNYIAIEARRQTVEKKQNQILNHSKQLMFCTQCGSVIDPWARKEEVRDGEA